MDNLDQWLNDQQQIKIDDLRGERNKKNIGRIMAVIKLPRTSVWRQIEKRILADKSRGIPPDISLERLAEETEKIGF